MATLTITRGLPGSGKTSWARAEQAVTAAEGHLIARCNRDEERDALHSSRTYTKQAEKQVTIAQKAKVEALLRAGVDVIVDDTNLADRYLLEWLELAARCGADVHMNDQFLQVPVDECVRRDALREGRERVGERVIRDMHQRYLAETGGRLPVPEMPRPRRYVPPEGGIRAVLVDLDGTMCLHQGRSPYDETRVGEDLPNEPVLAAVTAMAAMGHRVVFMSGRSEACRVPTVKWLAAHYPLQYEGLFMRAVGDARRDAIVKAELFDRHVRDRYVVTCVFDDRDQVIRMWRSLGLTVFQVAEGAF